MIGLVGMNREYKLKKYEINRYESNTNSPQIHK